MVVSDDDGPDFVDELEAELAARRPVPVQQDEPEGTCRLCAGEGWFGWEGVKVPGQRLLAQRKAHCKLCDGTGVERPVPVQQDEPGVAGYEAAYKAVRDVQLRCHELDHSIKPKMGTWPPENDPALPSQHGPVYEPSDFADDLVPVQQDEPEADVCPKCEGTGYEGAGLRDSDFPCRECLGHRSVPVQQDEPEGVCAFPNCSCTENRCPAKGERGPFCDHGFHPRLCGRCAPVPEAVTDEDEVQCQMCKTVQPRPDKECGHCGAGPKYLCPIHTRPAAVPVQQEPEDERMDTLLAEMGHERWVDAWREAADWRDQYRAGRDEVTGLLRAVVSEIDPMELTEMYAYLEADAYLATLDVLADSESNAAGGSEAERGEGVSPSASPDYATPPAALSEQEPED